MNTTANFLLMIASIATTAICWGIYGPVLHNGQAAMAQGRLRPLICVGIAYFIVAIVVPVALIWFGGWETDEKFGFNARGIFWSLAGGAAGAIGALGIVMAFTYGGTPARVMPIVFGLAPVINTVYSMWQNKTWDQVNMFYGAGLILAITGAVTVLLTAPGPKKPHGQSSKSPPSEFVQPGATPSPLASDEAKEAARSDADQENAEFKS